MSNIKRMPEVNAGSMADIAFLLLIFFLVTASIPNDVGLDKNLPAESRTHGTALEKNILRLALNPDNALWVDDQVRDLSELRAIAKDFIDNGGAPKSSNNHCAYCEGKRNPEASESPQKALILLETSRDTDYRAYVAVQNELKGAYTDLRNREAEHRFGRSFSEMKTTYESATTSAPAKTELKRKIRRSNIYIRYK